MSIVLTMIFILSLFLGSFNVNTEPCDDTRCKTGSCNSSGSCICDLPHPSTILDGNRPFLGGKLCDEEQMMCDGSNSFWCEHGGRCEEIVQGEIYACKCLPGYAGEHCQHSGAPCGRIFCFHEAECLVEGEVCKCPLDWEGSTDCSLPTQTHTGSATNSTAPRLRQQQSNNSTNWVAVVAISCSVGAFLGAVIFRKKLFIKKEKANNPTPRFQQLSQMQAYGILEEDEDDSMIPIHDDKTHT